jgi:hypothetical protein
LQVYKTEMSRTWGNSIWRCGQSILFDLWRIHKSTSIRDNRYVKPLVCNTVICLYTALLYYFSGLTSLLFRITGNGCVNHGIANKVHRSCEPHLCFSIFQYTGRFMTCGHCGRRWFLMSLCSKNLTLIWVLVSMVTELRESLVVHIVLWTAHCKSHYVTWKPAGTGTVSRSCYSQLMLFTTKQQPM